MPSIKDFKQKKKFRSWNNDILSELTLPTNKATKAHPELKKESKLKEKLKDNKRVTKGKQKGNKRVTTFLLSSIVGLQLEIILFIYEACKVEPLRVTPPITTRHIAKSLGISRGSLKMTILRLENKKLIERVEHKKGRGGWSKYSIPGLLFKEIEKDNKRITKG